MVQSITAAVLILERTHYDESMLEVIAPVSLKDSAGIHNGDKINLKVHINSNVQRKSPQIP